MNHYLTERDLRSLKRAKTFEDLLKIAFRALRRMPQPIGMVSGPISETGGLMSVEKNIDLFSRTIRQLVDKGLDIFDQMPFEEHMWRIMGNKRYYQGHDHLLRAFYKPIFESGLIAAVHFIKGWETSFGAKWEHDLAKKLGIKIVYL